MTPTKRQSGYDLEAEDLVDTVERFLSGLTGAAQDDVLKQIDPWRYKLIWALRENANRDTDVDMRFLACRLELEAILQHPNLVITTTRTLYAKVLEQVPEFPVPVLAQQDQ